jgi:pimeloyl-ACP methyl ester carboxylesterase
MTDPLRDVPHRDLELRGGARVHVAEAGAGTPVVLVHGNFASRRWWAEQLSDPPDGLRLIAPDLPNFGASDPLDAPITIDAYAGALARILDALELPAAVLVGHSLGAAVVERLAVERPERVLGLLLIDGAPPAGLPRPEEHYALLSGFVGDRDGLAAALAPMVGAAPPPYWELLLDDAMAMNPAAFEGNARALGQAPLPDPPAGFDAPVLVLHGGQDPLITGDMAVATANHWPAAHLEPWPDVGHSPQIEAPDRFSGLLTAFAKEADSS